MFKFFLSPASNFALEKQFAHMWNNIKICHNRVKKTKKTSFFPSAFRPTVLHGNWNSSNISDLLKIKQPF